MGTNDTGQPADPAQFYRLQPAFRVTEVRWWGEVLGVGVLWGIGKFSRGFGGLPFEWTGGDFCV